MSPLLQASYRGFTDIVNFLISNGADVNVTCHTNFYTPLMMASISGRLEISILGVFPRISGCLGTSEYFMRLWIGCCFHRGTNEKFYFQIEYHFILFPGKAETAKILLEAGAKVTTTNSIGKTAQDLSSFVGECRICNVCTFLISCDW